MLIGQKQNTTTRILGKDANLDRYPYIVKLHTSLTAARQSCGGTLVAPDMVLTAAYCGGGSIVRITTGHNTIDPHDDEDIMVDYEIVHPLRQTITTKNHDVALLKLTTPSVHPPIRLNSEDTVPAVAKEKLRLIGWGRPDVTMAVAFENLQVLDNFTYVPPQHCGIRYHEEGKSFGIITPDTLCAIGFNHSGG